MLSAVVVTYSVDPEVVGRCVASLAAEADRVIVVDTGGRDLAFDGSDVLAVPNDGFGAAANRGASHALDAGADLVMVMNDDATAEPGWRSALEAQLLDPTVGAVQPVVVERFDGVDRIASLGVSVGADGAGVDIGDGTPDDPDARGPSRDIDLFIGGAVLVTAAFLRATGGFDPGWFLYYEDVDLARRGAALGFRYRLATDATVLHRRGGSTSAQPDRTRFLQERNRIRSAFRHADGATIARALWLSVRRLRHSPRGVHARALVAGVAGAPRQCVRRWRGITRTGPIPSAPTGRP